MRLFSPATPSFYYGNLVNRQAPLNRGLVSWWLNLPLGGKGNTFFDIAGKNHGTLTSGPTWGGALGRPGGWGALDFDGTDDYVNLGNHSSLKFGSGNFSYAIWVRTTRTATTELIFGESNDTDPERYLFKSSVSDVARGTIRDSSANTITLTGTTDILNAWHHLVMVRDGLSGQLYVDGKEEASSSVGTLGSTDAGTVNVHISGRGAGSLLPAAMRADSARAYNRALSASEVAALYNESRQGYPTTLNRIRLPVGVEAAVAPGGTILPHLMQEGLFCNYGGRAA